MPTPNPRLTFTMTPATAARLRRVSELTGNSQGSFVSELLEQSGPVFDRMIRVLEAAVQVRDAARDETALRMAEAQARIEQQMGLLTEIMDEGAAPLLEQAEAIQRRRRKGPGVHAQRVRTVPSGGAAAGFTPPSNRGVRSDTKTSSNPIAARVSGQVPREKSVSRKGAKK